MTLHLCLLIHCLDRDGLKNVQAHKELFIHLKDVENLINSLKARGYRFALPGQIKKTDGPTCCFTFDDGYFNNSYFLELADKHEIPFILFVNSQNIMAQLPFIWDAWEAGRRGKWKFSSANYLKAYESLTLDEKKLVENDHHRPFCQEELQFFVSHRHTHLAPHTHTHQPLVGCHIRQLNIELNENLKFLRSFPKCLEDDFSLPCGLYTSHSIRKLSQRFKRIYTIDGGGFSWNDNLINRISLENPDMRGDLFSQIENSFRWHSKIKRRLVNIRYSNSLIH